MPQEKPGSSIGTKITTDSLQLHRIKWQAKGP